MRIFSIRIFVLVNHYPVYIQSLSFDVYTYLGKTKHFLLAKKTKRNKNHIGSGHARDDVDYV
jgi:hypothetical protein